MGESGIVDRFADLWNGASPQDKKQIKLLIEKSENSGSRKQLRDSAIEVLTFLIKKTGKQYRLVDTNLDPIIQRLKSGITVEQLRAIIANRVAAWMDDPKTREWLRPHTLFSRSKCEQYLGEVGAQE